MKVLGQVVQLLHSLYLHSKKRMQALLSSQQLQEAINGLAVSLHEKHGNLADVVFVGIQQGGAILGANIVAALQQLSGLWPPCQSGTLCTERPERAPAVPHTGRLCG